MTTGAAQQRRDQAIDVIRGLCIVSMVLSHTARDSPLDTYLHLSWVDGASGFFLMAGLVLGMVQRRTVQRSGLGAAERRFGRRLVLLYGAQLALVAVAVLAGTVRVNEFRIWPDAADHGGWGGLVLDALLLRVNPKDLDVLPVYVLLFLLALLALPVLVRWGPWPVAVGSAGVYVLATVYPHLATLPRGTGDPSAFNWGGWQALFASGFLVGWYWREADVAARVLRRRVVAVAAALGVLVYAGADLVDRTGPLGESLVDNLFEDKRDNAPGRVLLAWCTFVVLYAGVTWLVRRGRARRLRAELEVLGRWSLDAYLVLGLSVSLSAVVPGYRGPAWQAMVLAVAVCLVALGWAHLRERRRRPAPVRRAAAAEEDALRA